MAALDFAYDTNEAHAYGSLWALVAAYYHMNAATENKSAWQA